MSTMTSLAMRCAAELVRQPPVPVPRDFRDAAARLLHVRHLMAYEWALPFAAGKRVVEIGTHEGYGSRLLGAVARTFIGVDLSFPHALRAHRSSNAPVVQADGQRLPFPNDSADIVVSFQVIEHVWSDRAFLQEVRRVLRPGGLLLVSTPEASGRVLPGQMPWNEEHLREYDEHGLRARLREQFDKVLLLGLFGDEVSDRVERRRVRQDPWQHFFGGPWGRGMRGLGRVARAIRSRDPESLGDVVTYVRSADHESLTRHWYFDRAHLGRALDLVAICEKGPGTGEPGPGFDAASYWKTRLGRQPTLSETGTSGAPVAWQRWLYRGKERVYARLLIRNGVEIRGQTVLDFGCGAGHFEDVWERRGATRADGIDIAPDVIARLQARHPGRRYLCADLGRQTADVTGFGQPGIIAAIDVVYHIVSDEELLKTLRALCALLPAGGVLLFTDALQEQEGAPHVRFRSLNHWMQILAKLGLRYVDREPVFALNNRPVAGVTRFPAALGALQHALDVPVLRTMPWTANNWAVLAQR